MVYEFNTVEIMSYGLLSKENNKIYKFLKNMWQNRRNLRR